MDNKTFSSKEEMERALNELLDALKDNIEADDKKTTVLDGLKLKQIQFAYSVLQYITRGTDAKVSYKLNEPFKTMGSVSVEGSMLEFDCPEWFSRVAEFASNTEVYPLAKNKVRLTFTFHGLTKPIE